MLALGVLMIICGVIGWLFAKPAPLVMSKEQIYDLECMRLINELREREGWTLEICCDNPDFNNGPNCILDVEGEWLNLKKIPSELQWRVRRFEGDSLLKCLQQAKGAAAAFDRIRV